MPTRILIADDNDVYRKVLRKLLEPVERWEIVEARDGQEAVTKTLELRPDLVILDLAMPLKDGLSAAREISHVLPDVPILMCTMHLSPHLETEAHKSGIRKVLSKSDSSLLLPALQQILAPGEPLATVPLAEAIPPPAMPSTPNPPPSPSLSTPTGSAVDTPPSPLPKNVA